MRKTFCIAIAALFIAPAMAGGDVYRWKDGNGVWHYSDQPQPGAEVVRKSGSRPGNPASTPAPAQQARTAPSVAPSEDGTPPLSSEAIQQVRDEAATAKTKRCKQATDVYQNSINAQRLYKDDGKGGRVFLNDAEIDAARLRARSNRDIACGPSP